MGGVIEVDCPRIKALFTCFCSSIRNTNLCFLGFVVRLGLGLGLCLATGSSYFVFLLALVCLVHFPCFCLQPILLGPLFTIGKKVEEHMKLKEGPWNGFLVL